MKIRNFIEKKNPIGLTNYKDTMETKFNSSLIEPLNTKINKSLEESEGEKNINLVFYDITELHAMIGNH